ncbi:RNase A-like domain-containing protein [Streptomyces sp. NPDC101112]|uniref:RNase A-like domain-containing protein n=1 Tax=Streptomyces sp. NPDC101112 TaxID=3366105 RepID=UPI003816132A
MLTRSASYPDRETAHWATQQVVTANEQVIHRWLAQGTRARLTIDVDVRPARVVLRPRAVEPPRLRRPHDRSVLHVGAARTCPWTRCRHRTV